MFFKVGKPTGVGSPLAISRAMAFVTAMTHYTFPEKLHTIYNKALSLYKSGQRDPGTFFTTKDLDFLSANGLTAQSIFDYVEDEINYGEPGWHNAFAIEMIRRDYFLNHQSGQRSQIRLDIATMPAKTDQVRGIAWLPRLIVKSKAKLRGELPDNLMFGCGGDRQFFQQRDILPAEFLSAVWRNEHNDEAIINWVEQRSPRL